MKKSSRSLTNQTIAKLLRSVSAALTLSPGDNRFRIIAYDRAADAIEHSSSEVKDLWDNGKLTDLSGIGTGIASSLDELFKTGKVRHFAEILRPFPPAIFELMEIPGIGPKNALKLCQELGINRSHSAVSKLEKAAKNNQIAVIEGFGTESQANILKGIAQYKNRSSRLLLHQANAIVSGVTDWLKTHPEAQSVDALGSLRRQCATVGDLDIAVSTTQSKDIIEKFTKYPKASRVIEAGDHSASILLNNDVQVDLMVQDPKSYGSLLQHFTGSKHHNIALREYALKMGYSLSEYGIKTSRGLRNFATEAEFYNFLGLDWIPPELREDLGEIPAAHTHNIPELIRLDDIKGDLQIHSNIDVEPSHDLGLSSLSELSETAKRLGYEYIGVTEHNPSLAGHTERQIIDIIKSKSEQVRAFKGPVPIFNGLEIDILPDGRLALPEAAFEYLDYACVSIHSSFNQSRANSTARVLKALSFPKVKFFAHPTARILNQREGVDLDWEQIFNFVKSHNQWLEIDAWPDRLDLPDTLVRDAVKFGVKLIIDTDSHEADHMNYMRYGVAVARRGWVTKSDVVNTLNLNSFRQLLAYK